GTFTVDAQGRLTAAATTPIAIAASQITSGIVPIANGGTGISTSPAAAGQYLRSSGAGVWAISALQAADIPGLSGTYVDLSTAQTVGGIKSFSSLVNANAALNVAQNTYAQVGQAYLSSGGDYVHLANNEWYNGATWTQTAVGM